MPALHRAQPGRAPWWWQQDVACRRGGRRGCHRARQWRPVLRFIVVTGSSSRLECACPALRRARPRGKGVFARGIGSVLRRHSGAASPLQFDGRGDSVDARDAEPRRASCSRCRDEPDRRPRSARRVGSPKRVCFAPSERPMKPDVPGRIDSARIRRPAPARRLAAPVPHPALARRAGRWQARSSRECSFLSGSKVGAMRRLPQLAPRQAPSCAPLLR